MFNRKVAHMRGARLEEMRTHTFLQPECTVVHEDCKNLKQRSRWVNFRSNIINFKVPLTDHRKYSMPGQ